MEQQWRGDVVGQVADDAQPCLVLHQGAKIEAQCVLLVYAQLAQLRARAAQGFDQVAVEFDDIEHSHCAQQVTGECTTAWPDLNQRLARLGVYGGDDALNHAAVMQKMLTEALARGVSGGLSHRLCTPQV